MATADDMYDEANQLKEQGDLEGAVSKLQEILSVDPQHALTHSALAVHLQKLDRPDEAIQHAQKVVELQPDDAFSFMQLSVVLQRCGKIPEAEEAMFRARQIQMGG